MRKRKILRFELLLCMLVIGLSVAGCGARADNGTAVSGENQDAKEARMDSVTQGKMDSLFSSFAEARLPAFKRGQLSDAAVVDFCVLHAYIHNRSQFQTLPDNSGPFYRIPGYNVRVNADSINGAAPQYFGYEMKRISTPSYSYKDGFYYCFFFPGYDTIIAAEVTKLVNDGKGEFAAYTKEYTEFIDRNGAVRQKIPKGTRRGVIKQVDTGAKQHYILLEYDELTPMKQERH